MYAVRLESKERCLLFCVGSGRRSARQAPVYIGVGRVKSRFRAGSGDLRNRVALPPFERLRLRLDDGEPEARPSQLRASGSARWAPSTSDSASLPIHSKFSAPHIEARAAKRLGHQGRSRIHRRAEATGTGHRNAKRLAGSRALKFLRRAREPTSLGY